MSILNDDGDDYHESKPATKTYTVVLVLAHLLLVGSVGYLLFQAGLLIGELVR